jgi:hypothetical protein
MLKGIGILINNNNKKKKRKKGSILLKVDRGKKKRIQL